MTARTTTAAPVSLESRQHLTAHRDELRELAGTLEVARDEIRADALLGVPIDADVIRLVRDAGDLLLIASRRLDPDQETTR